MWWRAMLGGDTVLLEMHACMYVIRHSSPTRTASLHNLHSHQQHPISMPHHDIHTGTAKSAS